MLRLARTALVLTLAAPAVARAQIFSGVDAFVTAGNPRPNSDAARAAFIAAAGGAGAFRPTWTFEGAPLGLTASLPFAPQGVVLTTGGGDASGVSNVNTDQLGYNTTAGGSRFFQFAPADFGGVGTMTFTFATPVFAFGGFFTGVETFYGTTIASWNAATFTLRNTGDAAAGAPPAGVQFFGVVAPTPFTSITFRQTGTPGFRDLIGVDDVLVAVIPEPSTWALVGVGLAGLGAAAARRRRREAGA